MDARIICKECFDAGLITPKYAIMTDEGDITGYTCAYCTTSEHGDGTHYVKEEDNGN